MNRMKKNILGICGLLLLLATTSAEARIVTVTFTNAPGASTTNILEVQSGEILRGISMSTSEATFVYFVKNDIQFSYTGGTIAGPATLKIVTVEDWRNLGQKAYLTVEIAPESFPPDKTIIIPQGTPGENIIMEQSTDLVNWTNSVPGTYTNAALNHLFFRLRAERL